MFILVLKLFCIIIFLVLYGCMVRWEVIIRVVKIMSVFIILMFISDRLVVLEKFVCVIDKNNSVGSVMLNISLDLVFINFLLSYLMWKNSYFINRRIKIGISVLVIKLSIKDM